MRLNNAFYDGVPIVDAYYNGERIDLSDIVVYGTVIDGFTLDETITEHALNVKNGETDDNILFGEEISPRTLNVEDGLIEDNILFGESVSAVIRAGVNGEVFDPLIIDNETEASGVHGVYGIPDGQLLLDNETVGSDTGVNQGSSDDDMTFGESLEGKAVQVTLGAANDGAEFFEEVVGKTLPVIIGSVCDDLDINDNIEGGLLRAASATVEDSIVFEDEAEADVIIPPSPVENTIYAGKYIAREDASPLGEIEFISVGISVVKNSTPLTFYGFSIFRLSSSNIYVLWVEDNPVEETGEIIGTTDTTPGVYSMNISTDDSSFTVLDDVQVTSEQKEVFDRYFVQVIASGEYYGRQDIETLETMPRIDMEIDVKNYYSEFRYSAIELSLNQEGEYDLMGYNSSLSPNPRSIGGIDESDINPELFGMFVSFTPNNSLYVMYDTPVTSEQHRLFNKYFTTTQPN